MPALYKNNISFIIYITVLERIAERGCKGRLACGE